jgi:hypothetical protein
VVSPARLGLRVAVTASRPVDISELRKKTRLLVTDVGGEKGADKMAAWKEKKVIYLV